MFLAAAGILLAAIVPAPPDAAADFRDVAVEAGLVGENVAGGKTKRYLIEETGNGVALLDFDDDGWLDVFLPNGAAFDGGKVRPSRHYLYRNLGQLRFEDVTEKAGLAATGWAQGACAGDYDNDGDVDLYVTHYGHSLLYRNDGKGRLEDVSEPAGVRAEAERWDTGCTFFDYDRDGDLDLAVAGYMQLDPARIPAPGASDHCAWKGLPVACGPRGVPHGRPRLLRNEAGGRFRDVSTESAVGKAEHCYGFGVVASDFDNDAFPDLYIACDSSPSLLFRNRHDGTFEEIGLLAGAALNEEGHEQGGMGVDAGDFDEDGLVDIAKTNFSDDVPNLYRNTGDLSFDDRVHEAGLGKRPTILGWGVHFLDVDHDGLRDLLMINGHVYPEAAQVAGYGFEQPRLLYRNAGGGRFEDISTGAGPGVATTDWSSRGSAVGDLDNDGTLEVVVSNLGARPSLLKNVAPVKNWLSVRCVGGNGDAVGARVYLGVDGRRLSREVQSGSGYMSQGSFRLHFGLGDAARYERLEVRWPDGRREVFPGGPANHKVTIERGGGRAPE